MPSVTFTPRLVASLVASALSASLALAWPSPCRAGEEPSVRRFDVTYEVPSASSTADCPDREAFVAAIRARTPRSRLVEGGDRGDVVVLRVTIDVGPTSASGRLDVRDPDGNEQRRTVASRTCREVASGLALVAALLLDPDAVTGPEEPVQPPLPPPAPPPPSPPVPAPPPLRAAPPPPSPPPASRWSVALGPEIGLMGGIGPDLAPKAGIAGHVVRTARGLLVPSFHLSVDVGGIGNDYGRGRSTTYRWVGGTLRACPIQALLFGERLRLAPCAAMQAALHHGSTEGFSAASSYSELWLAPAALGSIRWVATPAIALELYGGAVFPMRRTRFFLAPSTTLYEVPAVAGTASLGLHVRFL